VILRRLYIYLVSAASLVVLAIGIAGLGSTFLLFLFNDPSADYSRPVLASYAAAAIVALPVWGIHMWLASRFARRDPAERASAIRRLYIYWACLVFAIFFLINLDSAIYATLSPSVDNVYHGPPVLGSDDAALTRLRNLQAAQSAWNALVVLAIWLLHFLIAARDRAAVGERGASATLRRWYMYSALFIGFVTMLLGLSNSLQLLWARLLGSNVYQFTELSTPISYTIGGFVLWSFHAWVVRAWHLEDDRKSTLRAVEGFLAVAFSIAFALYGGSQILYYSLARLLGVDNPGGAGNDFLANLGDPGSKLIVFAIAWLLVRSRLSRDAAAGEAARQASIRRLYLNLAALFGMAAAAYGVGAMLWTAAERIEAPIIGVSPFDWRAPFSLGITLFVVGGAVWLAHWRISPPPDERQSLSRLLYLWAALLGSVLAGLAFAAALVYSVLQQLIQPNPRLNDVSNLDFGHYLAAVVVALIVGILHWRVMRADARARPVAAPAAPPPPQAPPPTPQPPPPPEIVPTSSVQDAIDLIDWRRRVGDLYRLDGATAITDFRKKRDDLFRSHPQSPIEPEERSGFTGLSYFDYDPAYRVKARMEPGAGDELDIDTGGDDGAIKYRRAGRLVFQLNGEDCSLTVLSLVQYAGGLFVPFKDATSGHETYGGGRYLFDTAKDTDGLVLGITTGSAEVTLDFNYAYNPSCVYSPRWACPLAPPENTLKVAVRAGERMYEHPVAATQSSGGPV